DADALLRVLASGQLTGDGAASTELASLACRTLGTAHAFPTPSGTHALELMCRALPVGPGDDVICPSFTFVSPAHAIVLAGGKAGHERSRLRRAGRGDSREGDRPFPLPARRRRPLHVADGRQLVSHERPARGARRLAVAAPRSADGGARRTVRAVSACLRAARGGGGPDPSVGADRLRTGVPHLRDSRRDSRVARSAVG